MFMELSFPHILAFVLYFLAITNLSEKQTSVIGTKRNRFLIRQPRIKRDSDTNQQSPEVMEFDLVSPHSGLLSVPPPKIERHASEPAPSLAPSPHLLSVPQSTPFLVKQHSHPLLPSQSPPTSSTALSGFSLHRQLSHPTQSSPSMTITEPVTNTSAITTSPYSPNTGLHFVSTTIKQEPEHTVPIKSGGQSPSVILVSDPLATSAHAEHIPTIRMKSEELRRSASSPQATRELSLENPRSSHCPVIRPGPALGCNFCWNTIDAHGRILRRKTKYHCPECQTNLCIVPCFQEYHERQSSENPSNENTPLTSSKSLPSTSLRHYPKTGSI